MGNSESKSLRAEQKYYAKHSNFFLKKVGSLKKSFTLPNRTGNDVGGGPSDQDDFEFTNSPQWRPQRQRRRMSLDLDNNDYRSTGIKMKSEKVI